MSVRALSLCTEVDTINPAKHDLIYKARLGNRLMVRNKSFDYTLAITKDEQASYI